MHSLASAEPLAEVEVRLIARNNEVLGTGRPTRNGHVHFAAGLARGEGGQAPAAVVASAKGDYAFLSLKSPAFDLSDRGVGGRPVPAGLDAFVYTERGVYRTRRDRACHRAVARRARACRCAGAPLTLVMRAAGRRRIPPRAGRRQGLGGRAWDVPLVVRRHDAAPGASRAYTDPKRPAIGEARFMVEDYVPDRIEFDLASDGEGDLARSAPAQISVDGRFLYGAPASDLDLAGAVRIDAAEGARRLSPAMPSAWPTTR